MDRPQEPAQDASPTKSAIEDLEFTRKVFLELADRYTANVDASISQIRAAIEEQGDKPSGAVLRDLREMIGLLRRLDIKPDKGKRKDLKKVDLLISELLDLTESW